GGARSPRADARPRLGGGLAGAADVRGLRRPLPVPSRLLSGLRGVGRSRRPRLAVLRLPLRRRHPNRGRAAEVRGPVRSGPPARSDAPVRGRGGRTLVQSGRARPSPPRAARGARVQSGQPSRAGGGGGGREVLGGAPAPR